MITKNRYIDQLVKLGVRIAQTRLGDPDTNRHEAISKAILAVCQHLSHEASYRSDITELVRLSMSAAVPREVETPKRKEQQV